MVAWLSRYQVPLYVAALAVGAAVGLGFPAVALPSQAAVQPILAVLLYATFLGLPFTRMGAAVRDWRFFSALMVLNFGLVPVVVWVLSRFVAHDHVLLVGVLFVLLIPCIDYVIVFAGLARADGQRLLIAAPLLMLVQIALLPLYLTLFLGADMLSGIELAPFLDALVYIILLPLIAAIITQVLAAKIPAIRRWSELVAAAMVPLMMLTLAVVVMSQIFGVSSELPHLVHVVPIYLGFAAIMVPLGLGTGKLFRVETPALRALLFSGVTRNSLVILPLVLALPEGYELAPLAVVTQTLVELVVMVLLISTVPKLVSD